MNFETPAALWGLLALILLVLFSLWRQAAARTVVPSVSLWKKIPERNPPLRALRRPAWRLELFLQALALSALVAGLAGPFLAGSEPLPRKVALVFDTSARMLAGGRIERAKETARNVASRLRPGDAVSIYAAVPSPRRVESIDDVHAVHAHVDTAPLLAAAREEAEDVIYLSDRLPEGTTPGVRARLFGGPAMNVGIVEFSASDSGVFARIVNHGPPRTVGMEISKGDWVVRSSIYLPSGELAWNRADDLAGVDHVSLRLTPADPFPMDDEAHATRLGPARTEVSLSGRHVSDLVRALEAVGGVTVRRGGGEGLVAIGVDEEPAPAWFRVQVRSPESPAAPAAVTVQAHPLTAALRGEDFRAAKVGSVAAPERAGRLLVADGRVFGALWDGTLHLSIGMDPGGWPATASFPILWTNVIDFARRGAGGWAVVRTGRPFALPPEVEAVDPLEAGAIYEVSPSRRFVAFTTGIFVARVPGGKRLIRANLLDPRESDVAGVERVLDWDPADPAGRTLRKRPLGGFLAALALALVAAAWVLERRPGQEALERIG
jgi:hypothetical protein